MACGRLPSPTIFHTTSPSILWPWPPLRDGGLHQSSMAEADTTWLLKLSQTRWWSSCVVTYFWSPEPSCKRSDFHATREPKTHSEVVQPSAPAEILANKHQPQTHGWRYLQMIPAFICWIFPPNPTSSSCWVFPTEGSDIMEQRQRVPAVSFPNLRSTESWNGLLCSNGDCNKTPGSLL